MNLKPLGKTDLHIPPIVFGGNVFGWTLNEQESFTMLDNLLEAGFNTIDTADVYSRWVDGNEGGESETIIGKWMKDRGVREEVTIITKVGMDMGQGHQELTGSYILEAAEDSLKRLQTDYIDLYLSHTDVEDTPLKETLGAYKQLIDAGKVRHIGASNYAPDRLKKALDVSETHNLPAYGVFQPEYNLYDREEFESGARSLCLDEGLGVIPYFSLGSGFLTGKYSSKEEAEGRARAEFVEKYFDERGHQILNALSTVSERNGISQAGVALRWLIQKKGVTAPIASATKKAHLDAFVEAAETELSKNDMQLLDNASGY